MFEFIKKLFGGAKPEVEVAYKATEWLNTIEQAAGSQEQALAYPHPNGEEGEYLYCVRFKQGNYSLWSTFGFADSNSLQTNNQPQELCLVINSHQEAWGKALLDLADSQYGKGVMVAGATFAMETFINPTESRMQGFLAEEQKQLVFPDDLQIPLKLKAAWLVIPLYIGEVGLLQRTGRKQVLGHPDFKAFSLNRSDLSLKYPAQ